MAGSVRPVLRGSVVLVAVAFGEDAAARPIHGSSGNRRKAGPFAGNRARLDSRGRPVDPPDPFGTAGVRLWKWLQGFRCHVTAHY